LRDQSHSVQSNLKQRIFVIKTESSDSIQFSNSVRPVTQWFDQWLRYHFAWFFYGPKATFEKKLKLRDKAMFGNTNELAYSLLDKLISLLDENVECLVTSFSHEFVAFDIFFQC